MSNLWDDWNDPQNRKLREMYAEQDRKMQAQDVNRDAADLAALRAENVRLREALQLYADKNNWSTSARDERETGEFPDTNGNSPTVTVEFETGIPIIWTYDDDGGAIARAALDAAPNRD